MTAVGSDVFDYSTLRTVTGGLRFPEGPIALGDGSVLVCEIEGAALATVQPDGTTTRISVGGGANGAAIGPDGAVYVCNDGGLAFTTEDGIRFPHALADTNTGGCVQRVDLATGSVETVFTHCGELRIGNLNDIVFDGEGGCYIVDTTNGALYCADPIAGLIRLADRTLSFPNGAGNVCVANLQRSGISVISPGGQLLGAFVTPEPDPYVTNICFDGDTAYICSSGRGLLYSIDWPWPGLALNHAR